MTTDRPGFPLRINQEIFERKDETDNPADEEEYRLKWGEHNNQLINMFYRLYQVNFIFSYFS